MLTGAALYVVARTSGVPLYGRRLAWTSLWCYNVAALVETITLDLEINNGD